MILDDFSVLTKKEPEKGLTFGYKRARGRSAQGRITTRHKGGGSKKLYRKIDFGQANMDMKANVIAIEYDPFRTAYIALLEYADNSRKYIIAPNKVVVGDTVITSDKTEIKPGNRMKLKNILVGTEIHNIELQIKRGGCMVRSAGSYAVLLACEGGFATLKMPSGEMRKINSECFASIGQISRTEHKYVKGGKAGRNRWLGKRPTVRGKAMNPCDHPHGGGEGRTSIGMPCPKTKWGKLARGVKTRRRKHTTKYIIKRRNIK